MLMTMQGKRALVTGAGKGIGRGLVDELCNRGATVYALTRSQKDLDDIVKDHPTAVPLKCDLSDTDQIKSVLKDIDAPHMVVNNAGITNLQPFLETDVKEWDEVMDVNVKSIMVVSQVCAKKMIEEKIAGSIVNLSSMGAEIGLANHTAYCTSKGAVNQLTRVMALELGAHGIRTNCVQPTIVFTQMGRLAWSDPVKNRPMRGLCCGVLWCVVVCCAVLCCVAMCCVVLRCVVLGCAVSCGVMLCRCVVACGVVLSCVG